MDHFEMFIKLTLAFPGSTVNSLGEFIPNKRTNEFFNFKKCKDELEVKCKVLEFLSRGAFKSEPFDTDRANNRYHDFMNYGINEFLETDFGDDDFEKIYQYLGNGINRKLTLEFIESGYDLSLLKRKEG